MPRPTAAGLFAVVLLAIALLAVVVLLGSATLIAGCSDNDIVAVTSGDKLLAGTLYSADLDGDGTAEQLIIADGTASLTITDGEVTYRSRDRWTIVSAGLGDTDRDGLPEVVTLLDDDEGRHIGLFAYFGGKYRERLVTSEIIPRPTGLEVIPAGRDLDGAGGTMDPSGDLLMLSQAPAAGQTEAQTTLLRWNGFSFTSDSGETMETTPAE